MLPGVSKFGPDDGFQTKTPKMAQNKALDDSESAVWRRHPSNMRQDRTRT